MIPGVGQQVDYNSTRLNPEAKYLILDLDGRLFGDSWSCCLGFESWHGWFFNHDRVKAELLKMMLH